MPYKDPKKKKAWEKTRRKPRMRRQLPDLTSEADRLLAQAGFFEPSVSVEESDLDIDLADMMQASRPEGRHTHGRNTRRGASAIHDWSGVEDD